MKQSLRRAFAVTTMATVVAATLAAGPFPAAGQETASPRAGQLSGFGYKGTAVGATLHLNNVQVLTLKDAVAPLRCTRKIGRESVASSTLSAPENSLIALSASTSRTVTYRDGDRYGVRAVNKLGDVTLGDPTGEIPTPIVTITGLTTTADSFHVPGGYRHQETISQLDLDIDLLPDQEADDALQDLLDAIDTGALQPVLDVLRSAPVPIEIPGLGSIAMGRMKGTTSHHHAESDATALELVVDATGETQKLTLGHARSRIGGPTPGGVFRSTSMPLDVKAADGALHFGGVKPRTIPCEGTGGQTRTRHLDSASVLLPEGLLVGTTGIDYVFRGTQHQDGTASGFNASKIAELSIPALDLAITGITSRVDSRTNRPGGTVRSTPHVSIAKIRYQGQEIAVPPPGQARVVEGLGVLETRLVEATKWGKRVTGLRITLTDYGVVLDLGIAASQIFAY